MYPPAPDSHAFLGLAGQAWEPVRTLQEHPQKVVGPGGVYVQEAPRSTGGEMLSVVPV